VHVSTGCCLCCPFCEAIEIVYLTARFSEPPIQTGGQFSKVPLPQKSDRKKRAANHEVSGRFRPEAARPLPKIAA
jgi:hypothetical protein